MCNKDLEFEEYFGRKLLEEHEIHKDLHYTEEQLREIYHQQWEWEKNAINLELSLEPQQLDYTTAQYYLPHRWEMPRNGRLLHSDEELQKVLKLLVFHLGVKQTLDIIPRNLIEKYLDQS